MKRRKASPDARAPLNSRSPLEKLSGDAVIDFESRRTGPMLAVLGSRVKSSRHTTSRRLPTVENPLRKSVVKVGTATESLEVSPRTGTVPRYAELSPRSGNHTPVDGSSSGRRVDPHPSSTGRTTYFWRSGIRCTRSIWTAVTPILRIRRRALATVDDARWRCAKRDAEMLVLRRPANTGGRRRDGLAGVRVSCTRAPWRSRSRFQTGGGPPRSQELGLKRSLVAIGAEPNHAPAWRSTGDRAEQFKAGA